LALADEIPSAGTVLTVGDWSFRVQSVTKQRISEVVVEYHEPTAHESADS
jgi:CBS domain containing-hemolysin-like protein